MDKYEYRVKTEQMLEHYEKKQFRKAMEIADTIDWRRVKSPAMLNTVSEIYENNGEFQKSRDTLMIAFDRAPSSRKVVYRLAVLALKLNDLNEASDCYEEFVKLAPRDPNQFILKYRILKAQGSDLSEQISALEEFKKAEYIEKWAYELAKLYHEAGMTSKCLEECDDLILWFSEGKYVYQAMELKMKYKPLTPLQQEKYDEYKGVPKKEPKKAVDKKPERVALKDVKSIPQDTVSIPKEQIKAAQEASEAAEAEQQESGANTTETVDGLDATRRIPTAELGEALKAMEENAKADKEVPIEESVLEEPVSEEPVSEEPEEAVSEEPEVVETEAPVIEPIGKETPEEARNVRELEGILQHAAEGPKKSITTVVKGATLQEALANGVAMASGINPEDQKKMEEREEELRIEGQMKIEDILMEWEAKQKVNAEAIAKQKASDEERLRKEREALEARREAERLEAERREVEEIARRKAEEKARQEAEEKARREAEEKARLEAEEKARREAEEKARREAEEKARLEAEEARRKALLSDDIRQLVEELEDRVTAQEKEEENFDIEEELELAKAEGESVEEEIVDQFISEEELDDIVEEPEESEEEPEEEIVEAVSEEEETEDEDSEDEDDFEEEEFEDEDFEGEDEEFEAEDEVDAVEEIEEVQEDEEIPETENQDDSEDNSEDEDDFEDEESEEDDFEEEDGFDEDDFDEDGFADEFPEEDEEEVEEFDAEWNEFPEDESEEEDDFEEEDDLEEEEDFDED